MHLNNNETKNTCEKYLHPQTYLALNPSKVDIIDFPILTSSNNIRQDLEIAAAAEPDIQTSETCRAPAVMAGVKRKKGIASKPETERTTTRKRQKRTYKETSASQHQTQEPVYLLKTILDENKTQYLIDWEDDPATGEKYEPTWEPHENANEEAIRDWEKQKASKKKQSQRGKSVTSIPSDSSSHSSRVSRKTLVTPAKSRTGRPSRVIHSSPEEVRTPAASAKPAPKSTADLLEIGASQESALVIEGPESPYPVVDDPEESLFIPQDDPEPPLQHRAVTVQPSDPPSSYLDYEAFNSSQIISGTAPEPKVSPEPSQFQPDPADTSKTTEDTTEVSAVETEPSQPVRSVPVSFGERSALVVPDSQSLPDSSAFAPSQTQKESQSTGESNVESQSALATQTVEEIDDSSFEQASAPSVAGHSQSQVEGETSEHANQLNLELSAQAPQPVSPQLEQDQPAEISVTSNPDQGPDLADSTTQPLARETPHEAQNQISTQPSAARRLSAERQHSASPQHIDSSTQVAVTQESASLPEFIPQQLEPLESQQAPSVTDFASQPAVIAVTSGFTQPEPEIAFSNQVRETLLHGFGAIQEAPPTIRPPPTQLELSATSLGFQTQIAPAPSNAASTPGLPTVLSHSQPVVETDQPLRNIPGFTPRANTVPVDDRSPILPTSSPFPSIPAHSVPISGESAAALPTLPSTPTRHSSSRGGTPQPLAMESPAGIPGSGMAERIAEMRRQKRAERALRADRGRGSTPSTASTTASPSKLSISKPSAVPPRLNAAIAAEAPVQFASPNLPRDTARSPSTVPAVEPVHAATRDEMNTSERFGTLLPHEQQNGNLLRRQSSIASKPTSTPPDSIHVVPIALVGHQRDAYPSMIRKHEDLIRRFLSTYEPSTTLNAKIEVLLDSLSALALHPDLDNVETYTQYDVNPTTSAQWDQDASAKFRFLSQIIDRLRDQVLTIAVVGKPGRLLEILVTFFAGIKVTCHRLDNGTIVPQAGSKLTVYVVSALQDVSSESVSADVIIGLDKSAQEGTAMRMLQDKSALRPAVKMLLVAPGTIEHAERCLSHQLSEQQKLHALVKNIYQLRHNAGQLEEGQKQSAETADAIAGFVTGANKIPEWPLATLSMLEDLDSQTDSELEPVTTGDFAHAGEKRPLDNASAESPTMSLAKRPRLGENSDPQISDIPITINPMDIELTHVTDSAVRPSVLDLSDFTSSNMTDTELRLQSLLQTAQANLSEHVSVLSKLQYDFEDQRLTLLKMTKERDAAIATAITAQQRMNTQAATLSTLRAERADMQNLVKTAQEALLNHSVPERAELEQLRLALTAAETSNASLEARRAKHEADGDYARALYQDSSSQAQKLASENLDLTNQLSHAQNRATGEQARARQMTLDSQAKTLQRENAQLKARLRDREAALKFKDEELVRLKEAGRGRMGTRGSSVPRSPRLASPMKFAAGSRANSPVAGAGGRVGGGGHPLRQG